MKAVLEWFGLAHTLVAGAFHVSEEGIDPLERLAVLRLPLQVVVPGVLVPHQLHVVLSR